MSFEKAKRLLSLNVNITVTTEDVARVGLKSGWKFVACSSALKFSTRELLTFRSVSTFTFERNLPTYPILLEPSETQDGYLFRRTEAPEANLWVRWALMGQDEPGSFLTGTT
ncbi:hypothetical protein PROFUN_12637 [Planoprotostelium fungivorum]|uniref:Uncharacterized protein n=1 Tax=Planoprotostelium fungivorum TaxID=1890364 RepID=A0A2P6N743_9EUKA|nr:hypothetical protein PROFUN_12637 [Planoprotostelium fungivorum]